MRDVTLAIGRFEDAGGRGPRGFDVAAMVLLLSLRGRLLQVIENVFGIESQGLGLPLGRDVRERRAGGFRIGVQDRHEVVELHDLHSGPALGGGGVHLPERGAVGRRTEDAGVEEALGPHVSGVMRGAGDLLPAIEPARRLSHHLELGHRAEHRLLVDQAGDLLALGELGVGHLAVRAPLDGDDAVLDDQIGFRGAQLRRRQVEQDGAPLGRGGAEGRPEHAGGERAEGPHVPRTEIGIAEHHVDRFERHAELFGGHLGLRGEDPLAHLDLAGEDGDAAVRADPQIGVEILGIHPPAVLREQLGGAADHQDGDAAAHHLEELAAVEAVGGTEQGAHDLPPFACAVAVLEAVSTASRMRVCAPQRQRLCSSRAAIASRVGAGFSWRKAAAVRIIPGVQ